MLVNLVNKYGVVPKNAYPESSSSEAALFMNKFLRTKVDFFITKIIRHIYFTSNSYVAMLKKFLN
jgi:aminopeptidase C